ncbi:MAG: ketopantoate reductase C-terminal domain-containing protein [Pseudomonadota bacterium]
MVHEVDTLIVGAGAVGGVIAAMLQKSGHATGLLVRDAGPVKQPAVATIRVDHASGKAPLVAVGLPTGARVEAFSPQRVLVAVKYPALDAVAASLRALPTDVPIISCLNGVSSTRSLRQALPHHTIDHLTVLFNSNIQGPLHYQLTTRPMLMMEKPDPGWRNNLRSAGFMVALGDESAAWGKLLFNLNNAICTLTHACFLDIMRDRYLRRAFLYTLDEAVATLRAAKVPFRMPLPVPYWVYRMMGMYLGPIPAYLAKLSNGLSEQARPSMAADIAARRPTEVEQINGEICALGRRIRRPTPINETLVRLVRALEIQEPRRYLPPFELFQLIEAAR